MKRLTVIGAIMAALTVITGVYGMNFEHMPELHWKFGYLFVWVIMGAVTAGLWWVFRKKQWI
jgi:magnesium transporter